MIDHDSTKRRTFLQQGLSLAGGLGDPGPGRLRNRAPPDAISRDRP